MSRQFEDTQDSHDTKDLHDTPDLLEALRAGVGLDEEEGDKVGHDGENVYHIHSTLGELPLVRGGGEAEDVLQREPGDANGLDHGQLGVVDGLAVLVVRGYRGYRVQSKCNG